MSSPEDKAVASRRRFLCDTLSVSAGAAVVTAAGAATVPLQAVSEQAPRPAQRTYRLTEHVAEYYKTASF